MKAVEDVIQSIEYVANLFYQNKHKLGYEELEKLLILIEDTLVKVYQSNELIVNESNILGILKDAMIAMEQKDTLLLADILEYELKEGFKKLS